MKNKGLGCLVIILVFILCASVVVNLLQFTALVGIDNTTSGFVQPKQKFGEVLEQQGSGDAVSKDKVVLLDVNGIITSDTGGGMFGSPGMNVQSIKNALEQAVQDKNVKAVVLRVNTPGGEVTASDTLYNAVKSAAAKKPVVVYMDSMATSGGYYLSCGATHVIANETTLTGSIGVIIQTLNYSQAFGKVGLESVAFVSGDFKDSLSGSRPMREDEKVYVQNLVMKMYDKFVGIVAEARKIDKDKLKATVADGRVVTGQEALENKLVDGVGYVEDAFAKAKELGNAPDATVVRYRLIPSFLDIFGAMGKAASTEGQTLKVDVSDRLLPRLQAGQMYLLPSYMVP